MPRTTSASEGGGRRMAATGSSGRHELGPGHLWVKAGGPGRSGGLGAEEPALLLLHGLGATGEVWAGLCGLLAGRWPGRWVVPDLRGHGRSSHAAAYSFGQHAGDLAGLFRPGERVVVVGHSMGGVVGLAMASGWFGVEVAGVVGGGIKVSWTGAELLVGWAGGAPAGLVAAGGVGGLDPGAAELAGLGHNALVEDPERVLRL